MVLAEGSRLGPYDILMPLGAGGMGEVYKARDSRLDRTVAIKILPEALTADRQFRERLDREARMISQLDHPHICALHDVGEQDGTAYLVMPYLEGETLADRLTKGALPLDQALQYAIQIADALASTHKAGIVHRDLKPGNIMLTKSGAKLLDFGLAKTSAPALSSANLSKLPTTPPMTQQGTILGTLQYMAPEQLEGKDADARTDIFAFGTLVYEMVTGKKAFDGQNQASVIAAILTSEPAWPSSLQPLTPPSLDHLIKRCLAKEPDDRWQSARDVMLELRSLRDILQRSATSIAPRTRWSPRELLGWAVAAGLLVALVAVLKVRSAGNPSETLVARLSVLPPEHTTFQGGYAAPYLAMSPDARRLAFVPTPIGGRTLIWIRTIDSLVARPLAGTDGASFPFWSPDSRLIAFFADGKLKTIDSAGGAAHVICNAPDGRGGAWGRDGLIVFAPQLSGPLYRVAASGGQSIAVTALDTSRQEASHRLPSFLPDGRHFLFMAQSGKPENNVVYIGSVDSTETHSLNIHASKAVYATPGYLLFAREQSITAQPFDPSRLQLSGEAVSLGEPVALRSGVYGDATFSVADNGTLVSWSGGEEMTQLTWFDRGGESLGTIGKAGDHLALALSPDDKKVAVELIDPAIQTGDIWVIDLTSRIRSRLTFDPAWDFGPFWSPDGTRVVFGSIRGGLQSLYQTVATGGGTDEVVLKSPDALGATDWSSADGQPIVYQNMSKYNVGVMPLTGDRKPRLLLSTEFLEGDGRLSPNGRWLAYTSNESGSWDVYVQPFPSLDRKWRISPDGGSRPTWRRDGKELFYVAPDQKLMAVPVTADSSLAFAAGTPTPLFQVKMIPLPPTQPRLQYAATANGNRFLVNTVVEPASPSPITVVLNWAAGLKR